MTIRAWLALALGILMIAIGGFLAVRPLWVPQPLTGSRVLDMTFAALFLLRGVLNIRVWRRLAAGARG